MYENISIIGAGTWGTTLGIMLARKGIKVSLWSVFPKHNASMQKERRNSMFLKEVPFPRKLTIAESLEDTLHNNIILIAIPVKFIRSVLKKIKKHTIRLKGKVIVSVSKGIEARSLQRVSQLISKELKNVCMAVLSGPNIAKEIAANIPSTSIIACKNRVIAKRLQELFTTKTFRVYLHQDIIGVELGGALKNIIALACGIADGLGFGTNTKAALVTRGLVEITRLGKKMGAKPQTFWGISGLGDLVTTCFSEYSRNRFVGEQIGRGKSLTQIVAKMRMVAEGVETVKSAYRLSKRYNVEMPITQEVYRMLYRNKQPETAVSDLMRRSLKAEISF